MTAREPRGHRPRDNPLILFDERGERVPRIAYSSRNGQIVADRWLPGAGGPGGSLHNAYGYLDSRQWRPTWAAVSAAGGWRVFAIDDGTYIFLRSFSASDLWQPASPDHKRLPHIAAVEMWVRMKATLR